MKIIIETQFLAPIASFVNFAKAYQIILEINEHYQKRSYRNRCKLLSSTGPLNVSLPLKKGKNNQQRIKEVELSYDQDWTRVIKKQIQSAYGKSPYFDHYSPGLFKVFDKKHHFLFDLNLDCLQFLLLQLDCEKQIVFSESYIENYPKEVCDIRNRYSPLNASWTEVLKDFSYPQVFESKLGFIPNLSVIDLLFNLGPESAILLNDQAETILS